MRIAVKLLRRVDQEVPECRWGPNWLVWDAEPTTQVYAQHVEYTLLFLAGPRSIAEFIEPAIGKAATKAGSPRPDDAAAGRAEALEQLAFCEAFPSYQKVLAREGVSRAGELALIGTHDSVVASSRPTKRSAPPDLVLSPVRRDEEAL